MRATPRYSTRRQDPLNNVPHMPLPTTRIPAPLCLLAHSHSWASLLRKVTITSLPLQRHNNLYRLLVTVTEVAKKIFWLLVTVTEAGMA